MILYCKKARLILRILELQYVLLIATLPIISVSLLSTGNYRCVRPSVFGLRVKKDDKEEMKLSEQELSGDRIMSLVGTSPRRIFLSFASAVTISLGTNFLGGTSLLLSFIPEDVVEQSSLDLFYPRGPFKRVRGTEDNDYYSFLIPKSWVADTSLELAKASRRTKSLDYTKKPRRSTSSSGIIPDVAFGPPGSNSTSRTNVSVVVTKVLPGFTLPGTLGSPVIAANTLLQTIIAPEGSGRKATLLKASEEFRGMSNVYQFEYWLDFFGDKSSTQNDDVAKDRRLRAISVIAERNQNTLLTLTVVAPEIEWQQDQQRMNNTNQLRKIADSFKLYK